MKSLIALCILAGTLTLSPGLSLAQPAVPTPGPKTAAPVGTTTPLPTVNPDDLDSLVVGIAYAAKHAKWAWLVALALMLCTYLVNRILKSAIPKNVLVWIALGLGIGTNIALALARGYGILESIGQGVTLGLAAAGGWSAIGKYIFPKAKMAETE